MPMYRHTLYAILSNPPVINIIYKCKIIKERTLKTMLSYDLRFALFGFCLLLLETVEARGNKQFTGDDTLYRP